MHAGVAAMPNTARLAAGPLPGEQATALRVQPPRLQRSVALHREPKLHRRTEAPPSSAGACAAACGSKAPA
eukprot:3729792-Lingulodinium_polyedra.AAC.1